MKVMIMMEVNHDSLEHPGGLAAELVPDRALQQTLHQAAEHVRHRDLVTRVMMIRGWSRSLT